LFNKHAHCFPPPEKDPESCKSGIVKDCNLSIGASGHYSASYYGVGHNFIDLHYLKMQPGHSEHFARITVEEAAEWAGKGSVGKGAEWIRWSCNSDKWVLQQIGWKGHANRLDVSGSNAVYINWVDEDAIMVTENPKNNDEGQNSISHCNTAGDFWVQPPPGKEGMIQLKDGSWVPVLEKTTIHEASQTPLQHPKGISVSGNRLLVPAAALGDGHTAVSLFTINGTKVRRTIASRTGAVVDIQGLAGGAYMLKARGRGGDHVWRITLSR
jgi:hypothetical protein